VVALCIRTRRNRRFAQLAGGGHPGDPPPRYELDTKGVREGVAEQGAAPRSHVFEIYHPPKPPTPQEIDGEERRRSRISVTIQGTPPRHLGFQARF
jgi:hypothetical protein